MRIIGIDPGTGITGFGIIDAEGTDYKFVDGGVVRTPAKTPMPERLETIFDNITEIVKQHRPETMSIEKLFFAQNVTTAMTVSQSRGVVMLAGQQSGMDIAEYTPLQIKQAMTGYGRAEKQQMQEMVRILLKLNKPPKPDDCADALAAAICHAMNIRL